MLDSRQKGARGEREVIDIIQKFFGIKWARTPLSGGMDIKSDIRRPHGCESSICDLFHWEVKFQEKLNIWSAFSQSINDSQKDPYKTIPLVVYRKKNTDWRVTLTLDDFLSLLLELQQLRERTSATSGDNIKDINSGGVSVLLSPIGGPHKESYEEELKRREELKQEKLTRKAEQKEREAKYKH